MIGLSYTEDKNLLAYCMDSKNFRLIEQQIQLNKNKWTYYTQEGEKIFGYDVKKINQLTEIYGYDFYSVNFFAKEWPHFFSQEESLLISQTMDSLEKEIENTSGYYIIKMPTSATMLLNQFNLSDKKYLLAGGTIYYYLKGLMKKKFAEDQNLIIKLASKEEKLFYGKEIIDIGEKSFENYFGQYHISYFTREKAPQIYQNWIKNFVADQEKENLIIAQYKDTIVGFLAFSKSLYTWEFVLNAIEEQYRGLKIFEKMIRWGVILALSHSKLVVTSTQIDNYLSQRTWINCGFKPYNSVYLLHYNNI